MKQSTQRGTIIKVPDATPGLLIVQGVQHSFRVEGTWRSALAPAPNQVVDVEFAEGAVVGLTVVDAPQLAKERINELSDAAQRRTRQALDVAQASVGRLKGDRPKLIRYVAAGMLGIAALWGAVSFFGGPSKRSFAALIDAELARQKQCWQPGGFGGGALPVAVPQYVLQEPIPKGLLAGGYVSAQEKATILGRVYQVDLTPKGRQAGVYDPKEKGFCVGTRSVDEVIRWTDPANGTTEITYTWELDDHPAWVDEAQFADVPGMQKPVEGSVVARKTSDGWELVTLGKIFNQALQGLAR